MRIMKLSVFSLYFLVIIPFAYSQKLKVSGIISDAKLELTKKGKQITVDAYIPRGITEFELRIESDRNNPVSSARDIIPSDPDPVARAANFIFSMAMLRKLAFLKKAQLFGVYCFTSFTMPQKNWNT